MAHYQTIDARITCYDDQGIMSSGKWVYDGAVATSDRTIKKGKKVMLDGEEYIVEDRTAVWVAEKFDLLTIDIWQESCLGFATHQDKIIIL